jgi:hypothetical protein
MKNITLKLSVILVTLMILHNAQAQTANFGDPLSDTKAVKATKLAKTMDGKDAIQVKLDGTILEVCQMKGCWMTVETGKGEEIRVTFKDYGFFVPKDAAGKKAVFEGEAKMETVDVATLKHYAEDAGKSKEEIDAITEPETKLTFVASGVEIAEK